MNVMSSDSKRGRQRKHRLTTHSGISFLLNFIFNRFRAVIEKKVRYTISRNTRAEIMRKAAIAISVTWDFFLLNEISQT